MSVAAICRSTRRSDRKLEGRFIAEPAERWAEVSVLPCSVSFSITTCKER